ncbi:MAG: PKD domain-containing protein, partial [Thermoplasmata archaeon]|nr:PKD domain-containing protein [Thermoplasmata archaeon]
MNLERQWNIKKREYMRPNFIAITIIAIFLGSTFSGTLSTTSAGESFSTGNLFYTVSFLPTDSSGQILYSKGGDYISLPSYQEDDENLESWIPEGHWESKTGTDEIMGTGLESWGVSHIVNGDKTYWPNMNDNLTLSKDKLFNLEESESPIKLSFWTKYHLEGSTKQFSVWGGDNLLMTYEEDIIVNISATEVQTFEPVVCQVLSTTTIKNVTWSFGDGSYGYGEFTWHNYTDNGNYTISAGVTRADGS